MATAHSDVGPLLSFVVAILLAAKLGGHAAVRLKQPEVLGELVAGIVLGNLALIGVKAFSPLASDPSIEILSQLGVLLLLFEVGLETSVGEMMKVGWSSLLVALLGVAAPFGLGWAVGVWFYPDESVYMHIFLGATLTATSVGITARVLADLGKMKTKEARIILGAAVIDDILGLVVLAVVTGAIAAASAGGPLDPLSALKAFGSAFVFIAATVVIGPFISSRLFRLLGALRSRDTFIAGGLVCCFALSGLAALAGLAPIVGAFAAGLILEPAHYKDLSEKKGQELETLIHPISAFLVPIFFVVMGARVDLRVFLDPGILGFAAALTFVAIVGKQVCGFGVLEKGLDRIAVGLGMIPRGEVGLIFAGIGAALTIGGQPVVSPSIYGAIVIMVIVTTMATPPLIVWRFSKFDRQ